MVHRSKARYPQTSAKVLDGIILGEDDAESSLDPVEKFAANKLGGIVCLGRFVGTCGDTR